jgi:mono/diheme cytochrome c family protein
MGETRSSVVVSSAGCLLAVALLAGCGAGSSQTAQPPQAAPGSTIETPADDGATLLQSRCSSCHSPNRVKNAAMTHAQWDQTVTRMIDRGAQLTDAEKAALVDYLAAKYGP